MISGFLGFLWILSNPIFASPISYNSNILREPIYSQIEIIIRDHKPLIYKEISDETGKVTGTYMTKAEAWAVDQNKNQPFCKCGCSQKIVVHSRHRYRGIPEYLPYHQPDFNKSKKQERESWTNKVRETVSASLLTRLWWHLSQRLWSSLPARFSPNAFW